MARKFQELRSRMTPQQRQRSRQIGEQLRAEMALADLRQARRLTQENIAEILGNRQAAVSKIERRTDMHVSTLRRYVEALGGELEIIAHFPEGDVRISQFEEV
jgi:transcriptional regulator with XRE-family HTH domain